MVHSGEDANHKIPQNENALAESAEKFGIGLFHSSQLELGTKR